MVLASQMQEQEIGDGTNFVILFCGALLEAADELLKMVSVKWWSEDDVSGGRNLNVFLMSYRVLHRRKSFRVMNWP